ncbi:MAG: hypothetical protein ACKOTZ_10030 [Chloroflexota bacterium]
MTRIRSLSLGVHALAVALALTGLAGVGGAAAPALGASSACRVRNTSTVPVTTFGSLAAAVAVAGKGASLTVRGICHGTTEIAEDLSLVGVRPNGAPVPTLDGDAGGAVITVSGDASVTIRGLVIRDGSGTTVACPTTCGGGLSIETGATVLLRDVIVRGNSSVYDGAISLNGRLTLAGRTRVVGNVGTDDESYAGGVAVYDGATLILRDRAAIRGNTGGYGGGIFSQGIVRLQGQATVSGNEATQGGGGAYLDLGSTLVMAGTASIHHNTAPTGQGGGIYAAPSSSRTGVVCGGNVHDNTHEDCITPP